MGWELLSITLIVVLGGLLVSAGIEDARTREIANWKNATIALLAPVWWWASAVPLWPDVPIQLVATALVFGFFCVAFYFGQMGGGDVKLIGALALWLPVVPLFGMLVVMSILGGIITVLTMIDWKISRRQGVVETPYGVAIAIAGLLSLREPLLNQFT